jgi:hypothetical protein
VALVRADLTPAVGGLVTRGSVEASAFFRRPPMAVSFRAPCLGAGVGTLIVLGMAASRRVGWRFGTGDAARLLDDDAECWLLRSTAMVGVDRPDTESYDRSSVSSVMIRSREETLLLAIPELYAECPDPALMLSSSTVVGLPVDCKGGGLSGTPSKSAGSALPDRDDVPASSRAAELSSAACDCARAPTPRCCWPRRPCWTVW